jgi:hypothetical protein
MIDQPTSSSGHATSALSAVPNILRTPVEARSSVGVGSSRKAEDRMDVEMDIAALLSSLKQVCIKTTVYMP